MNTGENKSNNKSGKFFKGECNNSDKHVHRASDCAETAIKMTTETTIRPQESPVSMSNSITVEKYATGLLVVGHRKENIKTMTSTTSSWDPHSVDIFKKITMKNILNNG